MSGAAMAKFGKAALDVIKRVAPTVATGLGGPLAGMVTQVLTSTFGTDDTTEIENLLVSGNPDALLKLRESANNLTIRMRELDLQESQLEFDDTKDARGLAAKLGTVWPQLVLTFIAIASFSAVLYVLVVQGELIPEGNKDIVVLLVGQLSTFVGMGYSFFLGSSKGSKDKTAAMGGSNR